MTVGSPRCVTLSRYVEGTTWSLSRRIANPRYTNSVESQKWHVVGSWHWIMNETGAIGAAFVFQQYLGGRWSTHLHYILQLPCFQTEKKNTKKNHCNCSNEIKETNHRVDHLLDEILGICDSLLFDFLSENSAVEDLIAVYPMYRGVFLQHCILVVWSLLLLYGSPNDRCFFVVSLHFGCTWHSGCIFHVCSFQLDDWCIISSDGDDWKWGFYPDKISLMLMLNVNKCIQIC